MTTKKLSTALVALMAACNAHGQSLWTSAEMKAGFAKGLNAYVEGEYRTKDNLDGSDRWAASAGLDYKLCPWLKLSAGYTYIYQHTDSKTTKKGNIVSDYWQPRHRLAFAVTGSYKWNRFTFSLRERYQYTHRPSKWVAKYDGDDGEAKDDEYIKAKDKHALRSRLQIDYDIRKSGFTPFVSAEIYNDLNGFTYDKVRWTAGTEYKINKHHSVNVFYRYIDNVDDDDSYSHVIGVGYQYKL